MNFKRICRSLMCLLLACCLLFNVFPQKAEATGAGLAAATITGAATVTVSAPMVIGASLIALGIAAGTNDDFQRLVETAVSAAGDWVKDGTVELLQTVNAAGEKAYYVAGEMLDSLRSWMFDSSNELLCDISSFSDSAPNYTSFRSYIDDLASQGITNYVLLISSTGKLYAFHDTHASCPGPYISGGCVYGQCDLGQTCKLSGVGYCTYVDLSKYAQYGSFVSNTGSLLDLTPGHLPSQNTDLTDGTSARAWSEAMTNNGLYVIGGSNDPDSPDENNGKWFWPLALALTAAELWALSQADEWSGETPQEFNDYTTETEYEIIAQPEVEFGTGLEIIPAPGGEAGGESGGDSGGESGDSSGDEGSDTDEETMWFQRIVRGIEELPSKFGTWFTDLKTKIEEIPSKFASWFEKILEWLENIWKTLCEIPSTIANLFENLLSKLFAPAPDFIANKVEALKAKYPYLDTFLGLGTNLKGFFMNLGTKPPIIYIDLGSATGSYLFGGKTVFVDLTWYSQYKSLMDSIIGAFIWLWLAWRVFLSIPGIIQGEAGTWGQKQNDIGMGTTAPPIIFTQKALPSGKHTRGNKE